MCSRDRAAAERQLQSEPSAAGLTLAALFGSAVTLKVAGVVGDACKKSLVNVSAALRMLNMVCGWHCYAHVELF
jgi:hypothetical protein